MALLSFATFHRKSPLVEWTFTLQAGLSLIL
jgi:hypothetical protein